MKIKTNFFMLGLLFITDVSFNLLGLCTAFSIGWLIGMIVNYKYIREQLWKKN